jgi:alpha-2-macroglobulin
LRWKNIQNVKVSINASDIFIAENLEQNVVFNETGDQTIFFTLRTANRVGVGNVEVVATSGRETAKHNIEIAIRNPNGPATVSKQIMMEAGKSGQLAYELFGMQGTNRLIAEFSTIPPIDLSNRLSYLTGFPHGCFEQTISRAFPQLYLSAVAELSPEQKKRSEENVKAALARLSAFLLPDGSFTSWPGGNYMDEWGTNYAGHFMLEAEALGYVLPAGIKNQWISHQQKAARAWGRTTPATRYCLQAAPSGAGLQAIHPGAG